MVKEFGVYVMVLVVFVVGVSGIAISGESSLSISKPQSSVSGQRVDSKAASDRLDRGLESARKAVLKADQYPGVKRDIKSMEKEQAELEKRKSVLKEVVEKIACGQEQGEIQGKGQSVKP